MIVTNLIGKMIVPRGAEPRHLDAWWICRGAEGRATEMLRLIDIACARAEIVAAWVGPEATVRIAARAVEGEEFGIVGEVREFYLTRVKVIS